MGDSRVARDPLLPTHWFNILHDRPQYDLGCVEITIGGEVKAAGQGALLQQPLSLARQSINTADRFIPIPDEVLDLYAQYRPTPLRRAVRLEERLGANAHIYYKYEGANLTGSHKLNTALAQAYYYSRAGVKHLVTGTAAGQWGTALAYACQVMNLGCTIFWVRSTLRQKPIRGEMMRLFGAVVHESPSDLTEVGRRALKEDPAATGTLGSGHRGSSCARRRGQRITVCRREWRELGVAPPDRHRPGGRLAAGPAGRVPRLRHCVHGRRIELRRDRAALPRCGGGLREVDSARRRRVGRVSEADPRSLPATT